MFGFRNYSGEIRQFALDNAHIGIEINTALEEAKSKWESWGPAKIYYPERLSLSPLIAVKSDTTLQEDDRNDVNRMLEIYQNTVATIGKTKDVASSVRLNYPKIFNEVSTSTDGSLLIKTFHDLWSIFAIKSPALVVLHSPDGKDVRNFTGKMTFSNYLIFLILKRLATNSPQNYTYLRIENLDFKEKTVEELGELFYAGPITTSEDESDDPEDVTGTFNFGVFTKKPSVLPETVFAEIPPIESSEDTSKFDFGEKAFLGESGKFLGESGKFLGSKETTPTSTSSTIIIDEPLVDEGTSDDTLFNFNFEGESHLTKKKIPDDLEIDIQEAIKRSMLTYQQEFDDTGTFDFSEKPPLSDSDNNNDGYDANKNRGGFGLFDDSEDEEEQLTTTKKSQSYQLPSFDLNAQPNVKTATLTVHALQKNLSTIMNEYTNATQNLINAALSSAENHVGKVEQKMQQIADEKQRLESKLASTTKKSSASTPTISIGDGGASSPLTRTEILYLRDNTDRPLDKYKSYALNLPVSNRSKTLLMILQNHTLHEITRKWNLPITASTIITGNKVGSQIDLTTLGSHVEEVQFAYLSLEFIALLYSDSRVYPIFETTPSSGIWASVGKMVASITVPWTVDVLAYWLIKIVQGIYNDRGKFVEARKMLSEDGENQNLEATKNLNLHMEQPIMTMMALLLSLQNAADIVDVALQNAGANTKSGRMVASTKVIKDTIARLQKYGNKATPYTSPQRPNRLQFIPNVLYTTFLASEYGLNVKPLLDHVHESSIRWTKSAWLPFYLFSGQNDPQLEKDASALGAHLIDNLFLLPILLSKGSALDRVMKSTRDRLYTREYLTTEPFHFTDMLARVSKQLAANVLTYDTAALVALEAIFASTFPRLAGKGTKSVSSLKRPRLEILMDIVASPVDSTNERYYNVYQGDVNAGVVSVIPKPKNPYRLGDSDGIDDIDLIQWGKDMDRVSPDAKVSEFRVPQPLPFYEYVMIFSGKLLFSSEVPTVGTRGTMVDSLIDQLRPGASAGDDNSALLKRLGDLLKLRDGWYKERLFNERVWAHPILVFVLLCTLINRLPAVTFASLDVHIAQLPHVKELDAFIKEERARLSSPGSGIQTGPGVQIGLGTPVGNVTLGSSHMEPANATSAKVDMAGTKTPESGVSMGSCHATHLPQSVQQYLADAQSSIQGGNWEGALKALDNLSREVTGSTDSKDIREAVLSLKASVIGANLPNEGSVISKIDQIVVGNAGRRVVVESRTPVIAVRGPGSGPRVSRFMLE
jgi:hypothetical protein